MEVLCINLLCRTDNFQHESVNVKRTHYMRCILVSPLKTVVIMGLFALCRVAHRKIVHVRKYCLQWRRWWSISIFKMIANWRARYLDTILESVRSTCSHMCQWKQIERWKGGGTLLNKFWQAKKKKCFDYGYVYNFVKKSEMGDLAPPSLRFRRLWL